MLLLEACLGLARSQVCLSSSVCLLLKPWSRSAPFLHPTLPVLQFFFGLLSPMSLNLAAYECKMQQPQMLA